MVVIMGTVMQEVMAVVLQARTQILLQDTPTIVIRELVEHKVLEVHIMAH
jgi:hypothetical protein